MKRKVIPRETQVGELPMKLPWTIKHSHKDDSLKETQETILMVAVLPSVCKHDTLQICTDAGDDPRAVRKKWDEYQLNMLFAELDWRGS